MTKREALKFLLKFHLSGGTPEVGCRCSLCRALRVLGPAQASKTGARASNVTPSRARPSKGGWRRTRVTPQQAASYLRGWQ